MGLLKKVNNAMSQVPKEAISIIFVLKSVFKQICETNIFSFFFSQIVACTLSNIINVK